jgi:hypothetical protein
MQSVCAFYYSSVCSLYSLTVHAFKWAKPFCPVCSTDLTFDIKFTYRFVHLVIISVRQLQHHTVSRLV